MLIQRKTITVLALTILCLFLVAAKCNDKQATSRKIALAVDRVAQAVGDAGETRDLLAQQGILDRNNAYNFTLGLQKVNNANKTFKTRAEKYAVDPTADPALVKSDLKSLVDDITAGADELVANGTFGIKDQKKQQQILAVTASIREVVAALAATIDGIKVPPPKTSYLIVPTRGEPAQQGNAALLAIVPLLLLSFRKAMEWINKERERTGQTTEEIFASAGIQIDKNDLDIANALARYGPTQGDPAPTNPLKT